MFCEKNTFPIKILPAFVRDLLTKEMLLFDIETTGLSSARDQIYCIGCGYLDGTEVCVELFFAESPEDEKELLNAFSRLADIHPVLVTFNGTTFDIPFIKNEPSSMRSQPMLWILQQRIHTLTFIGRRES